MVAPSAIDSITGRYPLVSQVLAPANVSGTPIVSAVKTAGKNPVWGRYLIRIFTVPLGSGLVASAVHMELPIEYQYPVSNGVTLTALIPGLTIVFANPVADGNVGLIEITKAVDSYWGNVNFSEPSRVPVMQDCVVYTGSITTQVDIPLDLTGAASWSFRVGITAVTVAGTGINLGELWVRNLDGTYTQFNIDTDFKLQPDLRNTVNSVAVLKATMNVMQNNILYRIGVGATSNLTIVCWLTKFGPGVGVGMTGPTYT